MRYQYYDIVPVHTLYCRDRLAPAATLIAWFAAFALNLLGTVSYCASSFRKDRMRVIVRQVSNPIRKYHINI